jgi:hypothetical protein
MTRSTPTSTTFPASFSGAIQPTKDGPVATLRFDGPGITATTTIQYWLNHPDTKARLGQDSFEERIKRQGSFMVIPLENISCFAVEAETTVRKKHQR